MITTNIWRRLRDLTAGDPLQIGIIVDAGLYGVTIELPTGDQLQVRGTGAVGDRVFFRSGVVEGPAPDLPIEVIDI